jgi:hypothetical protein
MVTGNLRPFIGAGPITLAQPAGLRERPRAQGLPRGDGENEVPVVAEASGLTSSRLTPKTPVVEPSYNR